MASRKTRSLSKTDHPVSDFYDTLSEVDAVSCDIGQFIRERITEFRKLVDAAEGPHDDEVDGYCLREIAIRTLLISQDGDEVHRNFVESLLAAKNDVETFKRAMDGLDDVGVHRWLRIPGRQSMKKAASVR